MNEDYKELVEYLDKKFNKIDERFASLHEVFATKEEFNSVTGYLATKEDVNNLATAVDAYAPTKLTVTKNGFFKLLKSSALN